MSNKNDRWSALSMKERADLMNMYITNGISDLKEMKRHYNSFSGEESFTSKVPQYPEVTIKEEPWADAYFKQHPEVSGMAIGAGLNGVDGPRRVIINPYSKNINKDAVLLNERSRHYMEEFNFKLPKVTDEQMKKYEGTPYQNDTLNVGRTEAARFISGDKHLLTPEQIKYINSFSGEEDTNKKPIFDPEKIIKNVPAREFGPQKVMGENDYLAMPGTNSIVAPIQYFADKGTGKQNIEFAQQVISDFENIEDKQNHIKENSDYYKTYLDAIAYLNHVEALKKYLKLPYDTNTIKESNYKPTRLQGTDTKTYKFSSEENPEYWTPVINSMLINNYDEHQYIDPTLNTFTAYRDMDDRGDFVSIYDEWDYNLTTKGGPKILNKPIEMVTGGKPFVIYDRMYLDDYYNVPEGFKGNPYIAPAYVTAYTEKTKNKLRNMGISEKELEKLK